MMQISSFGAFFQIISFLALLVGGIVLNIGVWRNDSDLYIPGFTVFLTGGAAFTLVRCVIHFGKKSEYTSLNGTTII